MDGIECQNVTNFDVTNARNGKEVAWCKDVFSAEKRRDNVLRWLGANELEGRDGRFRRDDLGMKCP